VSDHDLILGFPHTNRLGFWEPYLLMQAGHAQCNTIAGAIGMPLSDLRTLTGGEVYPAFYYIDLVVPDATPIESFGLDDAIRFRVALRAFRNIAIEGRLEFAAPEAFERADAARGRIHFGNIFITPVRGNSELRVAAPANADFSRFAVLPNEENPYQVTRAARARGTLGLIADDWTEAAPPFEYRCELDPDRDTNGAGLVYFANYIVYAEMADRRAWLAAGYSGERSLRHRRVAYYGNAEPGDALIVRMRVYRHAARSGLLGHRCTIERAHDGMLICLSEAIKAEAGA
jgi:probable biosynthetic protein (TIGR04098 family)